MTKLQYFFLSSRSAVRDYDNGIRTFAPFKKSYHTEKLIQRCFGKSDIELKSKSHEIQLKTSQKVRIIKMVTSKSDHVPYPKQAYQSDLEVWCFAQFDHPCGDNSQIILSWKGPRRIIESNP